MTAQSTCDHCRRTRSQIQIADLIRTQQKIAEAAERCGQPPPATHLPHHCRACGRPLR